MKKQIIPFIILSLLLNAQEEKSDSANLNLESENNNNKKPILVESKEEVMNNLSLVLENSEEDRKKFEVFKSKGFQNVDELDLSSYQRVTLMDAVLETVATNPLVKAAREKVVQSEIKLDDAIAEYYPTLNLEYKSSRTRATDLGGESKFKYYNDRNYKFILSQNIYAGGETSNKIKNLKNKLDLAKNQYYLEISDNVTKAVKAYFDVVFAHRTVKANEQNMEKLNKILEIVSIKYENGAASIGDLTAIKANVANAQTTLVRVKSKFTEALKFYEYIVGEKFKTTLPYERNFNIDVTTFELLFERALKTNKDLVNFYESIEAEKYNLESKKSAFDPKLDFELYLDNIMDKDGFESRESTLNGMLKLTYNIYNGGKDKNKLLTSYSTLRELNFKLDEERKKLKWNISRIFTSIVSTKESLKSNITEVISLRKMVDAYWEEFKLGEQDLQALLQGQKQLNAAETELIKYENNNITDFFTLLRYTGDLLAFFDLDPKHPKFINFSNGSYTQDVYIDEQFLTQKEKLEKEEQEFNKFKEEQRLAKLAKQDENINEFKKKLLSSDDEKLTLKIESFKNQLLANNIIKLNNIDTKSFSFDKVNGLTIDSLIAHGIYEDEQSASKEIESLALLFKDKNVQIATLKEIKDLYSKFEAGLSVQPTPPEIKIVEKVQTVEKIKQVRVEPEFVLSEEFKEEFLNANKDFYTIHVTSFSNKDELEKVLIERPELYDNSFAYNYLENANLLRWVYGIFETYEDALKAFEKFGELKNQYYPVINKVSTEQELYKMNLNLNTPKEKENLEYEYIDVSQDIEYKEPVDIKDIDLTQDEELSQKVKTLIPQKELEENILEQQENVIEEKEIPVILNQSYLPNEEFKFNFLNAPKEAYSINIATMFDENKLLNFLSRYSIEDKTFAFRIGENKDLIKVMYGVFENRQEAVEAMEKLPKNLVNSNKPYLQKIFRAQDIYNLYNSEIQSNKSDVKDKELIKEELTNSDIQSDKNIKIDDLTKIIEETKEEVKDAEVQEPKVEVKEEKIVDENKEEVKANISENLSQFIEVESGVLVELTGDERILQEEISSNIIEEKNAILETISYKQNDVENFNNQTFKNDFLSAPESSYTVNLGTLKKLDSIPKFLEENGVNKDEIFMMIMGESQDQIVILSGIYSDRYEALAAIEKLPLFVRKVNKPYIEKIFRKQEKFKEYHTLRAE